MGPGPKPPGFVASCAATLPTDPHGEFRGSGRGGGKSVPRTEREAGSSLRALRPRRHQGRPDLRANLLEVVQHSRRQQVDAEGSGGPRPGGALELAGPFGRALVAVSGALLLGHAPDDDGGRRSGPDEAVSVEVPLDEPGRAP